MEAQQGRPRRAVEMIEESLVLARQMGDRGSLAGSIASSEVFLGRALRRLGRYEDARASLQRAIDIYQVSGSRLGVGWALVNLAMVELESNDLESAAQLISESYELLQSIGFDQGMAELEANLAHLRLHEGDLTAAYELAARASTSERYRGDRRAAAESRSILGRVALRAGDLESAESNLERSREILTSLGLLANVPDVLEGQAALAIARAELGRAKALLEQAATARRESEIPVPWCDRREYEAVCAAAGFEPESRSGVDRDALKP